MNNGKHIRILSNLFAWAVGIIMAVPFLALIGTSFKTFEDAITHPASLFPTAFTFRNYISVFTEENYLTGLLQSLQVSLVQGIGIPLSGSLVAYAFVRFRVREKDALFAFLMMSVMVPQQVLSVSMYQVYIKLGWMNTYWPFWAVPFLGGGIMNVFLMRQFFMTIPRSIYEAADIDGAGYFRQYLITLNLSMPILLTIFIFSFTGMWNDFMMPMIYLGGLPESRQPLALLLYKLYTTAQIGGEKQWNLISAGCIAMMVPIVILFFVLQKYFIEGISVTGLK